MLGRSTMLIAYIENCLITKFMRTQVYISQQSSLLLLFNYTYSLQNHIAEQEVQYTKKIRTMNITTILINARKKEMYRFE